MKLSIMFVLVFVGLACAGTSLHPRGCIYINGRCHKECEVGTHAYTTGCGPLTPEPSCEVPVPRAGEGALCDYSACHCDPPTVRREDGRCVMIEECNKL